MIMEYEIHRLYEVNDDSEHLMSESWIDDRGIVVYSRTYVDEEIIEQWIVVGDDLRPLKDVVHRNGEEESVTISEYNETGWLRSVKTYLEGELFDEILIYDEMSTHITKTIRMGVEIDRVEIKYDGDVELERRTFDRGELIERKVTKHLENKEAFEIFDGNSERIKYGIKRSIEGEGVSELTYHDNGELSYEYSSKLENDELIEQVNRDFDGGYESIFTYDPVKRESKEVSKSEGASFQDQTCSQYDEKGRLLKEYGTESNHPFLHINKIETGPLPDVVLLKPDNNGNH